MDPRIKHLHEIMAYNPLTGAYERALDAVQLQFAEVIVAQQPGIDKSSLFAAARTIQPEHVAIIDRI